MQTFRSVVAVVVSVLSVNAAPAAAQAREAPPYIPTAPELVAAMLELGEVSGADVLYDLGSGDGRIPITAAHRFGTRGVGYEHQASLVALSRARAQRAGVSDLVSFRTEDLFRADLSDATVVAIYLSAEFNLRLRPHLLRQLRPGSRVVSNTFHMGEWRADSTVHLGSGATRSTLYLWIVPASVDGFWSLSIEGEQGGYVLEIDQEFQYLGGSARLAGTAHSIRGGRVRGEQIQFRLVPEVGLESLHFTGHVSSPAELEGRVSTPGGHRRWRAVRFTHPSLEPR